MTGPANHMAMTQVWNELPKRLNPTPNFYSWIPDLETWLAPLPNSYPNFWHVDIHTWPEPFIIIIIIIIIIKLK